MSQRNQQPADFPDDEADSRRFNAQLAAMRPPRRPPPDLAPPMIECRLEEERAWAAAAKPIIPGETLTVYEGALAFRDRCHLPRAATLEDIEHYIGRPYEHELDPLRVTFDERSAKDEAERNRRTCWEVACELLERIANGMMRTVHSPGDPPPNKYAQVIRLVDYLRYAKGRGGYGDVVEGLIAQNEVALSEPAAEGDTLPGGGHPGATDETANTVLPPENPATPKRARERGRKPGSGAIDDNEALCGMLRLLATKAKPSVWAAAGVFADGNDSTQRRLARKFSNKWGTAPPPGKTWKDVEQELKAN